MNRILFLLLTVFTLLHAQKDVYVIGYIPQYNIAALDQMDISALTHVIAAFLNPDSSGDLSSPIDMESFSQKVMDGGSSPVASIGGGGSYSWGADTTIYSHLYADSNRTMFVNKLVAYAKEYQLAGIDVDIEGTALMHPLYDPFVQELADSLHANDLEIYSAYGVGAYAGADYAEDATLQKFDIIGTMSYGGVDQWNWHTQEDGFTYDRFVNDVDYFINRGVDPSKIAGGIAFYSVGFPSEAQSNYSSYFKTYSQLLHEQFFADQDPFYNDTLVNAEGNPHYTNSIYTIRKKIDYMDQNSGGIMIWELGQDNYSGGPRMLDSIADYIAGGSSDTGSSDTAVNSSGTRVVGYSYGTDPLSDDVDYSRYTHVIGSFVNSDSLGNVVFQAWISESDMLATLQKAESAGALPMVALGTTTAGWAMTQDSAARANFVSNLLTWCDTNGIKGIDLDLEGTAEEFNWGNPGTFFPEPYESLAVELRAAMPDSMILTSAVGSHSRTGSQWTDTFIAQLDWINVMVYDRALSWESSPVENHSTYEGHLEAASYWHETRGLAKERVVLGVPFYARGWDRDNNRIYREDAGWDVNTWDYNDFVLRYNAGYNQDTIDFPATDSILYARAEGVTGKGTLFFNSPGMIAKKTTWTLENGYGGMMVWHVAGDLPTSHDMSLLRAMDSVIAGGVTAVESESIRSEQLTLNIAVQGRTISIAGGSGEYAIALRDLRGRLLGVVQGEMKTAGVLGMDLSSITSVPGVYIASILSKKSGAVVSTKLLFE